MIQRGYEPTRPGRSPAFVVVIALVVLGGLVVCNWPALKEVVEKVVPDVVMDSVRVGR